ncbi:MAG: hypothetical protein IT168_10810 [Bryobacterales bacterium]|nr:hypothetical protein [Bryobacterales bacterium]
MTKSVAFLHTSPAAIPPLMQFYTEAAPDLQITNLLDDGLLRMLSAGDRARARERLAEMLDTAQRYYNASAALVTCSSVSTAMVRDIQRSSPIRVLKIDTPMARAAVGIGGRIGICVTFKPTIAPTTRLIEEAAQDAGTTVELIPEVMEDAYTALLGGRPEEHDRILLAGIQKLSTLGVNAIVLAQVSMARILPKVSAVTSTPVLSSLSTSLQALRNLHA